MKVLLKIGALSLYHCLILFLCSCFADGGSGCVVYKEVIFNISGENSDEIIYGPDIYPFYREDGLPEKFWIRKKRITDFCLEDIDRIEIEGSKSKNPEFFSVHFFVKDHAKERLVSLYPKYKSSRVAILINNRVIQVVRTILPLKKSFGIAVSNISIELLISDVKELSETIIIKRHLLFPKNKNREQ